MSQRKPGKKVTQNRYESQLERLFDLLPNAEFEAVQNLPYASRALIEIWHAHETSRLAPSMSRVIGGVQHSNPVVIELLNFLAAEPLDLQQASGWLAQHRGEISTEFLAQLVSEAMGRGVLILMRQRGKTKRNHTTVIIQNIGRRWLELEATGLNKTRAAEVLAKEFSLTFRTVYNYLSGDVEANKRVYPNGANFERNVLGLELKYVSIF
jgi:hypothetical protein